ncbi:rootletin-like [Mercenaria mercenaria]|uniref:rootletin-like n=1 Tax=Mercenaria mercenaria TaxID=6596 RepID=UPI00234E91E0|nr:rootletin-like [Mercenaria mercenaria]
MNYRHSFPKVRRFQRRVPLSELEQSLKGDSLEAGDSTSKPLLQQNIDLRRKLEEEHASNKRKLQAYQDGQARQAQLVQKLQAKVLQYKKQCEDYEDNLKFKEIMERDTEKKVTTSARSQA